MDRIEVIGIRCNTRIGVPDNERQFLQEVRVDVFCEFDFTEATGHDDFGATVDYESIVDKVRETAARGHWSLLESLTKALCDAVFEIPRVRATEVRVKKFPVALRDDIDYVVATVRRERPER